MHNNFEILYFLYKYNMFIICFVSNFFRINGGNIIIFISCIQKVMELMSSRALRGLLQYFFMT